MVEQQVRWEIREAAGEDAAVIADLWTEAYVTRGVGGRVEPYVPADFSSRPAGRALAVFCERRARAAGWSAIALWSRSAQVDAHRLYESRGYRRLPERDSVDESGQARVVFRLDL